MKQAANITAELLVTDDDGKDRNKCARLLDEWQAWVNQECPGSGERRELAFEQLQDCLKFRITRLDLSHLRLTTLPDHLPDFLQKLDVSYNCLRYFPENLPQAIKELQISHNQLTTLPGTLPAGLKRLQAVHNQLVTLPVNLPVALVFLDVSHNHLTALPSRLPDSLITLNVTYNQLTMFPNDVLPSLTSLDISHNQITRLPDILPVSLVVFYAHHNQLNCLPANMPKSITTVNVMHNMLTHLPEILPTKLDMLCASNNQLTHLPVLLPASVETLDISHNQLVYLPTPLPVSLKMLYANHNQLASLPNNLPIFLQLLDVAYNQLTRLPEMLPDSLTLLSANGNLFLDSNVHLVDLFMSSPGLSGWHNSLSDFLAKITCWDKGMDTQPWKKVYTEEYANVFAEFLCELHFGKNSRNNGLCQRVVNWLAYLVKDNHHELRKHTFLLAREATESCVDRASFYFNHMYILMLEHQCLSYDMPLIQVIDVIKGTFRLQVLARIAADKVAVWRRSLPNFEEELEIYLAYQCALQGSLSLPIYTDLQFNQIAGITKEDIHQASQTVTDMEKTDFLRYWLTESALWSAKLEKWDPAKKAAADSQYLDEIASTDFNEAVNKALSEKSVPVDDADAHRNFSQALAANLFYQQRYRLTRQCLAAHQALSLLDGFSMTPVLHDSLLLRTVQN